ncbi:EAL domain-containing protein [Pseudomarimonas salicorniae]|uniref:EAL domain-containing protein n=1 Tax=Pseudomarimonas salicorniae TaxID=2933270 RepID=A0ABT0GIV9_9GAMM|nr:EAL domain-containing protein [Lysobacter sp. CAU 1642]MCK7594134.1 EAL domain-containing protein [Lysobacter sp. CAU 1642]
MAPPQRALEALCASPVQALHLIDLACRMGQLQPWSLMLHPERIALRPEAAQLHGLPGSGPWPLRELLGCYDEASAERLAHAIRACLRHGETFDLSLPLEALDGERLSVRWAGRAGDEGVVGVLRDDTAAAGESWRERTRQRYLAAMAGGATMRPLLASMIESFEARHPGAIGSILLVDQAAGTLHPCAAAGLPADLLSRLDGVRVGGEAESEGPCGLAAYGGQRIVVPDLAADARWPGFAALAAQHGLHACWSTPVPDVNGRALATFGVYYRSPRGPGPGELRDIDALVSLVGFAVSQSALLEDVRHLLDSAAEVICVFDDHGRFVRVNRAAESLWGRSPESLVGESVDLLVHPDDRARTREEMARVMGGIPAREFPNRNVTADGRVLHMLWSGTWSPENRRMYCFGRDVSAQRRAQAQMRLLERAVESSRSGVLIADARAGDFPLLYANAAMERMTGYPREAFAGRNCRFLQGADRDQPQRKLLREALKKGRECNVVLRNYRADGSLFWNELSLTPVRDEAGAITHVLAVSNDITERRRFEEDLARAISHDAVTELPRYAALEQSALPGKADGQADGGRWWLLFIDVDRFHGVNESMGDQIGDLALRQIAQRLRDTLGGSGRLSRFAGDEFVAVVPQLDRQAVVELAECLRSAVARPISGAPFELRLTASIGISGHPEHGRTPGELLRRAEAAMAQAKREGRDVVCVYSEATMQDFEDRLSLGVHLRGAVERDELELHYQPQFSAEDGSLSSFEALVRWTRSPLGPVPPGRFVPIAESLGLMPQVGGRVLELACRQWRAWQAADLPPVPLAINVSAQQILRADFAARVAETLAEHEIPRGALQFELTESSLMESLDRVRDTLDRLRDLGISLALDDFGTGYSSLAYLKRFAFDKLKIDRSFVSDLRSEGSDAAIARTIIAIGHELGMRVSAEGVETAEQMRLLRGLGCDELQGFLLGRPESAESQLELVRTGRIALDSL